MSMIWPSTLSCHDFPSTMIEIHEVVKIQIHAILEKNDCMHWKVVVHIMAHSTSIIKYGLDPWCMRFTPKTENSDHNLQCLSSMACCYPTKRVLPSLSNKNPPIRYSRDYSLEGTFYKEDCIRPPKSVVVIKRQGIRPDVQVCVL